MTIRCTPLGFSVEPYHMYAIIAIITIITMMLLPLFTILALVQLVCYHQADDARKDYWGFSIGPNWVKYRVLNT